MSSPSNELEARFKKLEDKVSQLESRFDKKLENIQWILNNKIENLQEDFEKEINDLEGTMEDDRIPSYSEMYEL